MQVKLPNSSSRRSSVAYLKLLERVRSNALNGFHFEGTLLKPGAMIEDSALPDPAIIVEGTSLTEKVPFSHRSRYLYLLWRYDRKRQEFQELARVWGESWEWTVELAPIARAALEPVRIVPDLSTVALKLQGLIDREMQDLEPNQRALVAGLLHDRFATELLRREVSDDAVRRIEAVREVARSRAQAQTGTGG